MICPGRFSTKIILGLSSLNVLWTLVRWNPWKQRTVEFIFGLEVSLDWSRSYHHTSLQEQALYSLQGWKCLWYTPFQGIRTVSFSILQQTFEHWLKDVLEGVVMFVFCCKTMTFVRKTPEWLMTFSGGSQFPRLSCRDSQSCHLNFEQA